MLEAAKQVGLTAVRVTEIQIAMMETALRSAMVYVPSDEMHIESSRTSNEYTLVCRGLPLYRTRCDMTATELEVEGWWMNWPPPTKASLKWGKKFSIADDEEAPPSVLAGIRED